MSGRIPQSFIDDLLDRLDIVEVIDRRVSLKKSGRNYTACCPFHDEKTPSFSVNQEKQFFYCFGCGAGGNAIGFIMDYERMGFPQAVETLADTVGLEVPREATVFQEEPQQKKNIYSTLEKATDFYRQQLKTHPQKSRAVDYLKMRGLSGEIARDFDLGYAPPGWDNLLKAIGQSNENSQLLIDGGLLIDKPEENKCYDRFRDRIIFPIHDIRGRVIAFGGRVLGDEKPKYLNSPETTVFHKSRELYGLYQSRKANRQLQRLLIVEGYMDVVALAQHGINWAAATLGTATSTEHLTKVFRLCSEVIFCFDGDEAGRRAATRALESALPVMEDGRLARFLFLPQGEDPDTLVRQIGASRFTHLVDQAQPLEDFLFESMAANLNLNTLDGRARFSKTVTPMINQLPAGIFKELMMTRLAETTGLSTEKLAEIQELHEASKHSEEVSAAPDSKPTPEAANPVQRSSKPSPPEATRNPILYAIALLLHEPKAAKKIEIPSSLEHNESIHAPLLMAILELLHKRPESTSAMLIGRWYGEPWGETLQQLLQLEQFISEADLEQELIDTLSYLDQLHQRTKLDNQVDKLLSKDYAQLSEEEKTLLKQSLSDMHSK